jgi:hypothetical protein
MSQEKFKDTRKPWFRFVKKIMRLFIKETKFTYLGGEKINEPTIILSNHVGTSAPLAFELYGKTHLRFWGASEMNSGLISLYKYQTRVYYHEKKHWNIHLARLFCLIASPLTNMFYKGLELISTYRNIHFKKTIDESIETLQNGKSVVIFPEISDKGYLDELEGFHHGFAMLCSVLKRKGIDVPITVAYFKKQEKHYIVDKPVMLSEIFVDGASREEIAINLCNRCNELGKMNFPAENAEDKKAEKVA